MISLRARILGVFVAAAFALVSGPIAAGAGPLIGSVGPGFFGTSNVNLDLNIPVNSGSAGARVVDDLLIVTDQNGLTTYDISDPSLPVPKGFVPIPQQYYFTEEDVPSNGEIALVGQYGDLGPTIQLNVVDLDGGPGGMPTVIGELSGMDEHTFECARDCTWAYGSEGSIIDLTDPTNPRDAGEWDDAVKGQGYTFKAGTHDVTEVVPGILLSSSNPMFLMDIRTTPEAPEVIGVASFTDNRFIHANLWPYHGELPENPADPAAEGWEPDWDAFDDFVLVGGETSSLVFACGASDGAFMTLTWDHLDTDGDSDGDFVQMTFDPAKGAGDEYRPEPGTFTDGGSAYSQYCTHWFTTQPGGYEDGGLLAIGWYEYGVRFLDIEPGTGEISESGWLIPMGGSTSAAYFVDETTVYTADYQRGVDIISYDPDVDPEDTHERMVPGVRFERVVFERPQELEDWYLQFGCPLPQ